MIKGDIVTCTSKLANGNKHYHSAIVMNIDPFILMSSDGEALWCAKTSAECSVIGEVSSKTQIELEKCLNKYLFGLQLEDSVPNKEEKLENEIEEKGLIAPRVTPEHINSIIDSEEFVVVGSTTICILKLKNGYTVTGEIHCVSGSNYNKKLSGEKSRERAREKIWPLEGYLLQQKLFEENDKIKSAFDQLKELIHNDSSYAWGWHCNIAIPMIDNGVDHKLANACTSRIMQHLFNVDTSQFNEYKSFGYDNDKT